MFKNSVDSLKINNGKMVVPMVIAKKNNNGKTEIIGFVPGLLMNNIKANSVEEVEEKLSDFTKLEIKRMFEQNENFPFFPTDDSIQNDYDNVLKINHLNVEI